MLTPIWHGFGSFINRGRARTTVRFENALSPIACAGEGAMSSTLRMPRLIVVPTHKQARFYQVDKGACLRTQIFALARHDTVTALWKIAAHIAHRETLVIGVVD